MLKTQIIFYTLLLVASACSRDSEPKDDSVVIIMIEDSGNDGGSDAGIPGDADMIEPDLINEEGGPIFINLSFSPMQLEANGSVTITAQLTDPDGWGRQFA